MLHSIGTLHWIIALGPDSLSTCCCGSLDILSCWNLWSRSTPPSSSFFLFGVQGAEAAPLFVACTRRKDNNESRQSQMNHFLSFSSNTWQAALLSVGTTRASTKHQASMYAKEKYQKKKKTQCKKLSKDLKRWREEVDWEFTTVSHISPSPLFSAEPRAQKKKNRRKEKKTVSPRVWSQLTLAASVPFPSPSPSLCIAASTSALPAPSPFPKPHTWTATSLSMIPS